ncbi:MAG: histidine--tRNA ligase [bacterium]|nr:histidine--tRNA ligase [bacterium]
MQQKDTMNTTTPQTLKGFRDFLPAQKRQRDLVAAKMKTVFETFGFEPLETPTLEYGSLLTGKYGEEAEKLIYLFTDRGDRQVGLRYDQTVPTARVLAQYQAQLPRNFRRYQVQNVFRADKPQKGRFREFTQCDCDIFGSNTLVADAEILAVFYQAFAALGMSSLMIEINDRRSLMAALSPFASDIVPVASIIQSIDKLDKISPEVVSQELQSKGLSEAEANKALVAIESAQPTDELRETMELAVTLGVPATSLRFNAQIARGLDYYTGLIFEGKIEGYAVGSLGGGGRYDNLISELSGVDMPAVGFGIGFDRTVEAAEALGLLPNTTSSAQVLVALLDETTITRSLAVAQELRKAGISTEIYPTVDKLAKQLKMADQKSIRFVVLVGETELTSNTITLKNMRTGEQSTTSLSLAIEQLEQSYLLL